jgi:hypothetical protein
MGRELPSHEIMVTHKLVSCTLVLVLLSGTGRAAIANPSDELPQKEATRQARLKQQVLSMPDFTYVKLRLQNGQKLRGRIVSKREDDFQLQSAGIRNISYGELKSVKGLDGSGSAFRFFNRRIIVHLAVIGGILAIAFVTAASLK